jgi:hypothetical protein
LGDNHNYSSSDYDSWDEMEKAIIKQEDVAVILPLYLYDHSSLSISTNPFSCKWDSGQVGFIFVSKETLRKEYGVKYITEKIIEKATVIIKNEVETYNDYLSGSVYGFTVEDVNGKEIDSCWGFFGESGMNEIVETFNQTL